MHCDRLVRESDNALRTGRDAWGLCCGDRSVPARRARSACSFHPRTDEGFYVADGEATFLLGDREHRVSNGAFVFIPRGTVHTVWNSGDVPVRGLIVISPGDAEHEFVFVEPA